MNLVEEFCEKRDSFVEKNSGRGRQKGAKHMQGGDEPPGWCVTQIWSVSPKKIRGSKTRLPEPSHGKFCAFHKDDPAPENTPLFQRAKMGRLSNFEEFEEFPRRPIL